MASPFAKYQSEQVQQLAPGFVEGFASAGRSIGQGIAAVGAGVGQYIEKAEQKKQEEAKIQGMLSPYLKTDPRVQNVKAQLDAGMLKKDDKGNVYIPDEYKDKFDPAKANDAISFYNETGGDGSKLTGPALTKFATAFEAEKKYASEQAGLEDKRIERYKVIADIRKTEAEAASKYASIGNTQIAGLFAAGADMSTFSPAFGTQAPPSVLDGTPYANGGAGLANRGTVPQASTGSITSAPAVTGTFTRQPEQFSLTPETGKPSLAPSGAFSLERYQAGRPVVQALKEATPSATATAYNAPTKAQAPAVAGMPSVVTEPVKPGVTPADTSAAYLTQIPVIQQARVALDAAYQSEMNVAQVNYNLTLSRMNNPDVATLKYLDAAFKTQNDLRTERYKTTVATMADRLAAYEKSAAEARAAQGASTETLKNVIEFGVPIAAGQKAPEPIKKETFSDTFAERRKQATIIPGYTGGTKSLEMGKVFDDRHEKIMNEHPTWYNIGLTTKGGDEYRYKLMESPSDEAMKPNTRSNVDLNVIGYNEGRDFLTGLLEAVNGTDDNRVKNYLDRFLATTSKDDVFAEGEMLAQFGVASFRKAIVSGGNFSDQDRIFIQSIITRINTPNVFADKEYLLAQTKKLASFIDSKFRAGLAPQGVRVDLDTSEKFLRREGDDIGLAQLERTKAFYTGYSIDPTKVTRVNRGNETLDPAAMRKEASAARAAGNEPLANRLEQIIKENQKSKDEAAKKATEAAAKARK